MSTVETPPQIRIGPHSAGMLLTVDEFDAVRHYDARYRYELIHGVLIVSPIPLESEAAPNDYLGRLLINYQEQHPQGKSLDATLPERYVRTPESRRRADRVIWAGLGRMPDPNRDTPSVAVEFVSAARRDRRRDYVEKRDEYRAAAVREYWVIDRFDRSMTAFISDPSAVREVVICEGDVYRSPLLPGFELPLARLLAIADNWSREE